LDATGGRVRATATVFAAMIVRLDAIGIRIAVAIWITTDTGSKGIEVGTARTEIWTTEATSMKTGLAAAMNFAATHNKKGRADQSHSSLAWRASLRAV
jgi:hypothetical protein